MDLALLEQDARRLTRGERQVLRLGIVVADDLVAPFDLAAAAVADVDLGLIAPDANQLLERRAQQVIPDVSSAVVAVADEDEARLVHEAVVALPIAAERAGHRDRAAEFVVDKAVDIGVAGVGERAGKARCRVRRQDDRPGNRRAGLGPTVERRVHRVMIGTVEGDERDPRLRLHRVECRLGCTQRTGVRETEQHLRAAIGLHLGDCQRLVGLVAGDDEHRQPAAVDRTHGWTRQIGRSRLLAHRHAVRHFEVMTVVGGALVGAEEDAGLGDVARRRKGLGHRLALDRAREAHLAEELPLRSAGAVAAQLVHAGEDGADALAGDRAGKQQVDADAARPEFEAELARQGVHRRLGHHIGGAAVIFGAAENRRDVDDRSAAGHRCSGGAHHVPRDAEDVARCIRHRLGIGRAVGAMLVEVGAGQWQLFERRLGPGRAGVIDEDIKPAMLREHCRDPGAHRRRVGTVHHHGRHLAGLGTGIRDRRSRSRLVACCVTTGQHNRCAFEQVVPHDLAAKIAGGTCDQRNLASEAPDAHRRKRGLAFGCHHLLSIAAQASYRASLLRRPSSGSAWLTT